MLLRTITLFAFALLAGCSSLTDLKTDISERMFGPEPKDPPMALADFKQKAAAKLLWSESIGEAEGYNFTPALDGKAIFAASAKGEITRIDAISGKQAWQINAGERISGGVGAGENLVLVGTARDSQLICELLQEHAIPTCACRDAQQLHREIAAGATACATFVAARLRRA